MIKNDTQLAVTDEWISNFESSLATLDGGDSPFMDVYRKATSAMLETLNVDKSEYLAVREGNFEYAKLLSIPDAGKWLIQARIARGMKREKLAHYIGVDDSKLKVYETEEYATAPYHVVVQISKVLFADETLSSIFRHA